MPGFLQWVGSSGAWLCSPFAALPSLHVVKDAELQEWCTLAGGLALILSRATPRELEDRFSSTRDVYLHVRRRLGQARTPKASAALLAKVVREIEAVADPMTKASARARLKTRLQRDSAAAPLSTSPSVLGSESGWSRRSHSPNSTGHADFDSAETQFSADVFTTRSAALRKSVAGARTSVADLP
jgi:hypothetical protein